MAVLNELRESSTRSDSNYFHHFLTARFIALAISGTIATIILLGWTTPIGKILPQDWYLMKANTALGILLGTFTLSLDNWRHDTIPKWLKCACISLILLLSTSALIGHIGKIPMWLDTFLGPDPYSDIPGRMSLQTALFLCILGLTLAFDCVKINSTQHIADTLCIGLTVIVLVIIAGYVFNAAGLYGQSTLTLTSPHTLACMIFLVFVTITQRMGSGLFSIFIGNGIGSRQARITLPLVFLVPFLFVGFGAYSNEATVISATHATVVIAMLTSVFLIMLVAVLSHMIDDATARLMDSEQQKHLLLNFAGEGICGIDMEGKIISANPTAGNMLGYPSEELIGKSIFSFIKNQVTMDTDTAFIPVPGSNHCIEDKVFYRRDGSSFPVQCTKTRIEKNGSVSGMVLIFADISERKKVERLKDEFVSTVSHELRTPLTSIKGSLALVMEGGLGDIPEQAMHILRLAHKNSDRLEILINDLLDIGKIESPLTSLKMGIINIDNLIDKAVHYNQGYADKFGVHLSQIRLNEDSYILGDENRLIQVLSNLISNATKYSSKNGRVVIACRKNRNQICISITDNGPGIPLEYQDKIFQKFTQADSSNTRRVGGTGLGLAISKEIINKHKGQIWFESEPGRGTTFTFSIPTISPFEETLRSSTVINIDTLNC